VSVAYVGTSVYLASASSSLTQTVNPASTKTVLTFSSNPVAVGRPETITATVSAVSPGSGTPSGTLVITIDGVAQAPQTLSGGVTTFTISTLALGNHKISAAFTSATVSYLNSTSATSTLKIVNPVGTSTVLTSDVDPSVFGQAVTLAAKVTSLVTGY